VVLCADCREDGAHDSMKPSSKPFDRNLYEADDSAKYQIIEWLRSQGAKAELNPDQFGIDILTDWGMPDTGIEVEVKHNWRGPVFPFKTVHFASRKFKFLKTHDMVYFAMLNHERTHVLLVDGEDFKSVVTKNTIYTEGETFFEIPIDKCKIVKLEE
jgi:hypothetical protein